MKLDPPLALPENDSGGGSRAVVAASGSILQPILDDLTCLEAPMATAADRALEEVLTQGNIKSPLVKASDAVHNAHQLQLILHVLWTKMFESQRVQLQGHLQAGGHVCVRSAPIGI